MGMLTSLLTHITLCLMPLAVQPPQPSPGNPPATAREVPADGSFFLRRLERMNAHTARDMLKSLSPQMTLTVDELTNTLVGYLSAAEAGLVNQLLNELERNAAEPVQRAVQLFPLRHRNADRLIGSLEAVVSRMEADARLAADKERNVILAAGGPEFLKSIGDTVRALDTPSPGIPMEFALLSIAGDPKNTQTERGAPLPADLKAVGEELAAFGELRYLGRVSANANVGSPFEAHGTLMNRFAVLIEGQVLAARDQGAIDLRFKAAADQVAPAEDKNPVRQQFRLDSTITAMSGDTLVLGSAPTGNSPGDAVVLVLRLGKPRLEQ